MAERRQADRQRWTEAARRALSEHGATEGGMAEHYRNVWTWMPEYDRPVSASALLPLLMGSGFGHDTNGLYFWVRP